MSCNSAGVVFHFKKDLFHRGQPDRSTESNLSSGRLHPQLAHTALRPRFHLTERRRHRLGDARVQAGHTGNTPHQSTWWLFMYFRELFVVVRPKDDVNIKVS